MANRLERGVILGLSLVTASGAGYIIGERNGFSQPAAIVASGEGMPSNSPKIGDLVVSNPSMPSAVESATPKPSANVEASAEAGVKTIKIESAEAAANRFGADTYSKNPSNWEINEYGGAHLKETENAVKVNTNGAVIEGFIKSKMTGETNSAFTFVADPSVKIVEANGVTAWDFGGDRAGFQQVLGQVQEKEPREQPGVTVVPLCADLEPINTTDVAVNKVSSAEEAAKRFGGDDYSKNPSNWEINEWGGAHLKETGKASLVILDGATAEGWIKANRANGRDAVTFVTHANVMQTRANGATLWDFENPDRGFQQLLGQVLPKEAVEQPDVTVLPSHNCVVTQ